LLPIVAEKTFPSKCLIDKKIADDDALYFLNSSKFF